jgi:hypothetical protein
VKENKVVAAIVEKRNIPEIKTEKRISLPSPWILIILKIPANRPHTDHTAMERNRIIKLMAVDFFDLRTTAIAAASVIRKFVKNDIATIFIVFDFMLVFSFQTSAAHHCIKASI